MLQFEIIGADSENYFLMAFDEEKDMSKGVFFYKIPISYFDEYLSSGEAGIDKLIDIELCIESMYKLLIAGGFLRQIDKDDFANINIQFGGGIDEIINR